MDRRSTHLIASRRDMLQLTSAAPFCAGRSQTKGCAAELCRRWREVDVEARKLVFQWQRLETFLFERYDWPKLTAAEQRRLPEAAPLFAMDERLSKLHAARQDLLPLIQGSRASSRSDALSKLDVLASVLDLTDSPEAHALLVSALADIHRLWQ